MVETEAKEAKTPRALKTAFVIKAELRHEPHLEDPFAEIRSLARTAGIDVLDSSLQRLSRPYAATYLGRGKVEEAAARAAELDVDFLLTDNDLSPAQERNLEKISGRTVIDRSQLIMDIFAQRAATHQAKLQVELAQLRYSLPRLKRLWTHLSRYEGGIGMRGPGEKQLETDKRLIRKRIQKMARELAQIERRKESALEGREKEFVVALVGYTNAGKSTLLNALTGADELVEDKLFATLDTRVRRWRLGGGKRHVLLTDTVGFIRDLPHHLVASFHATLAETREADLLLHVIDASSADAPWQIRTVERVLDDLGCAAQPTWLALNKWDRIEPERLIDAQNLEGRLPPGGGAGSGDGGNGSEPEVPHQSFRISARGGMGLDGLEQAVLAVLERRDIELEIAVPHGRGDVLAYLRQNARVERTEYRDDAVIVHCGISPARESRLRHIFPEGFPKESPAE